MQGSQLKGNIIGLSKQTKLRKEMEATLKALSQLLYP